MMKRRTILATVALASTAALPAFAAPAKVMVPGGAGGGWDGTGRLAFDVMQRTGIFTDGATFTNKGGAAGTLGLADFVKNKGQDDSVMIMGVIMVGGIITNKSPVTLDQVTPLARLTYEFNAVAVPADSPIKTAKDLLDALKKDPGAFAIGGGSAGGVDHFTAAELARVAGVPTAKLNYIPYTSGADVVTSLGGGKIKAAVSGISEMKPQADAGRIRFIAVTSEKGSDGVKSLKEQGVNIVIGNWRGIVGAPGMSEKGKQTWLARLERMSKTPEWKDGLEKQGLEDAFLPGDKFSAFLKDENTKWSKMLKDAGIAK
jgi:putative tricarboxylic transport membrane protein